MGAIFAALFSSGTGSSFIFSLLPFSSSTSISSKSAADTVASTLFSFEWLVPGLQCALLNHNSIAGNGSNSLMLGPSSFIIRLLDNDSSFMLDLFSDLISFI